MEEGGGGSCKRGRRLDLSHSVKGDFNNIYKDLKYKHVCNLELYHSSSCYNHTVMSFWLTAHILLLAMNIAITATLIVSKVIIVIIITIFVININSITVIMILLFIFFYNHRYLQLPLLLMFLLLIISSLS